MNKIQDFFRKLESRFIFKPRTPNKALRAFEQGLLPIESFIYKACSITPLETEPVDIEEVERILGHEDNDLATNQMLVRILERLLKSKDKEIALFAAESLNVIENRYNQIIEENKDLLKKRERDPHIYRNLGNLYFELALLNKRRVTIRNFYLKEAFNYFRELSKYRNYFSMDDLEKSVYILLELGLTQQALSFLQNAPDHVKEDPLRVRILEAQIHFAGKDFLEVLRILSAISTAENSQYNEYTELLSYWQGR
ncbi:MAG: hypothetical protein DRP87_06600 [Spirochaetes bacterium]|nr:MAG: hypothetical protein DRP87_06600 [Spirochaetota bacterium]